MSVATAFSRIALSRYMPLLFHMTMPWHLCSNEALVTSYERTVNYHLELIWSPRLTFDANHGTSRSN